MKTINKYIIILLSFVAFFACENDGDLITISSLDESDLIATQTDVVLSQAVSQEVVLSLSWTTSTLTISDTSMSVPNIIETTLQVSTTEDFSGDIDETVESELSCAYTGSELNTLAKDLEATPDVATPIYFRLMASVGDNMEPVYSNIVTVNITSYDIDMTIGYILDSDMDSTGVTLYSAESDGIYLGFIGATSWYNFYLEEGDGSVWGNDGVIGTSFVLSASEETDERWNCWFPGQGGCYYVDFNTIEEEWSALYIPALTVSGDIEGELKYSRTTNQWSLTFNASATTYNIQISGKGSLYNVETGTDDASAVETAVAFIQNDDNLVLSDAAVDITVTSTASGEATLTIDLNDPTAWTIEVVSGGGSEEPTVYEYLYLAGVDDLTSGSWTFDNYISLYDEDNLAYSGVIAVNSEWGYGMYVEVDNWDDYFAFGEGDAYSGTLVYQSSSNIPAPEDGLYLIEASLSNSTYTLTSVSDVIYLSGLNDTWDFATTLAATETTGIYSGEITITTVSEWGFQIHIDDTWSHYFGGSAERLYYKSNITDDATLGAGTYTMTVDLISETYNIE